MMLKRIDFRVVCPGKQEGASHLSPSTSKAKLITLTATIVIVTVLIAPLTPLALGVILLFSSLSVLGIASMPGLANGAHAAVGVEGQTLLTHPAH